MTAVKNRTRENKYIYQETRDGAAKSRPTVVQRGEDQQRMDQQAPEGPMPSSWRRLC